MARKRSGKKVPAPRRASPKRNPRKEPYDSERIAAVVERMREQAARLSALARALDDAGVKKIVVDGHAMLLRGLNQIDNFTDNAQRAVREAKTQIEPI